MTASFEEHLYDGRRHQLILDKKGQDELIQRHVKTDSLKSLPAEDDEENKTFWLLIGGSIAGAIILFTILFGIIIYMCYKRKKLQDELKDESVFIRKTVHLSRYSSSDNGESPPTLNLPSSDSNFKGSLSSIPVQPKTLGHQTFQPGLLTVTQSDCYGTSDEEDAQAASSSGKIWFSLAYDRHTQNLFVHLVKIRYLKGRGMTHELRDPFVRLYLLPDEVSYEESKVRRRTLSPKYNQTFTFQLPPEELGTRILRLSVYDVDKRNVRHSLGHALISLIKVEETSLQSVMWRSLEIVSQRQSQLGELQFSLCCNPYTERIKITIMRAKNLIFHFRTKEQTEIFFRVELYFGRKVLKVKETPPQKANECVEVLQNFSFSVAGKHFESSSMVVTIWSRKTDCSRKDEPYGRVAVGPFMYARGDELQHWQEMVSNPRIAIEKWHNICEVTQ